MDIPPELPIHPPKWISHPSCPYTPGCPKWISHPSCPYTQDALNGYPTRAAHTPQDGQNGYPRASWGVWAARTVTAPSGSTYPVLYYTGQGPNPSVTEQKNSYSKCVLPKRRIYGLRSRRLVLSESCHKSER